MCWGVGKCEGRCRGCGKVCWGVREDEGRFGIGVGKRVGMWESVLGERGEVCGKVRRDVGKGMRGVGGCKVRRGV